MKRNQPWIILFLNKALIFTFTVHNIRAEAQGKQAWQQANSRGSGGFFWKKKEPSLQKLLLNSLSKLIGGLIARWLKPVG